MDSSLSSSEASITLPFLIIFFTSCEITAPEFRSSVGKSTTTSTCCLARLIPTFHIAFSTARGSMFPKNVPSPGSSAEATFVISTIIKSRSLPWNLCTVLIPPSTPLTPEGITRDLMKFVCLAKGDRTAKDFFAVDGNSQPSAMRESDIDLMTSA